MTELLLYNRNLVDDANFTATNTPWIIDSTWSVGSKTLTINFGVNFSVVSSTTQNITIPAFPAGTVINTTTLEIVNAYTQGTSKRNEMRVALGGAIYMPTTQLSTLASGGTVAPNPSFTVPNPPLSGGSVSCTCSETVVQSGINAKYGIVRLVINYDTPGTVLHVAGTAGTITQTDVVKPGITYRVLFDMIAATAGDVSISLGTATSPLYTVNGTQDCILTADGTDVTINASSSFDGRIANVRIMEYPDINSVDLVDDILIPLTFNINDIKDIASRKGSFSKTVSLPGTHKNNKIFRHIYEIANDNVFNPNKKTKAVLLKDGVEIFNGVLKLNKINRIQNGADGYDKVTYEVVLSSSVVNIMDELKKVALTDLDFSEYDHELNRENQVSSWDTSIVKNGYTYDNWNDGPEININSTSIHTDGTLLIETSAPHNFVEDDQIYIDTDSANATLPYRYYQGDHKVREVISSTEFTIQMAWEPSYGNNLTGTVRTHSPTGEGYVYTQIDQGQNAGDIWKVTELTPAIYAKNIIDKMLDRAGVTYTSSFFDSPFFKRLVVPPNGKGFRLTPAEIALRDFRVGQDYDDFFQVTFSPLGGPASGGYPTGYDGHMAPYNATINSHAQTTYAIIVADVRFNNETTAPNYDPNNDYNTSNYIWTCPANGIYDLNVEATLAVGNDIPFGYDVITNPNYGGYSQTNPVLRILNVGTNTVVYSDSFTLPLNMVGEHAFSLNWASQYLLAGEQYKVQFIIPKFYPYVIQSGQTTPTSTNLYTSTFHLECGIRTGASFYTTFTDTVHTEGETVSLVSVLPEKVTCAEFLKSIVSMFNLFIDVDKEDPRHLLIETRDDFYAAGQTRNWTDKLDPSQMIELTPLGELAAKNYEFAYKEDKDYFNKKHLDEGGIVYGNYVKTIDNDFLTNTNKTELVFASSPIADLNGSSRPLTTIVAANAVPVQPKVEYTIRILYYSYNSNGHFWHHQSINDLPFTSSIGVSGAFSGSWSGSSSTFYGTVTSGFLIGHASYPFLGPMGATVSGTVTGYPGVIFTGTVSGSAGGGFYNGNGYLNNLTTTTPNPGIARWSYPYAGHLDKAHKGQIPTIDLNWTYPKKVYFPYNTWTENNLYNVYYKNMIEEITDKDSKIVDAYVYLKPRDIFELDFRDNYFIDGHYLRLMKITDYQVGQYKPTKCTFLKIENGLKFTKRSGIVHKANEDWKGVLLPDDQSGELLPGTVLTGSNRATNKSKSMIVQGENNTVGPNTKNVTIIGNNNFINGGLENVILINTNDVVVTESNVTYINGILIGKNLEALTSGVNLSDGGYNTVFNQFNTASKINLIDGGLNSVLGIGSHTNINLIDSGLNDI